LKINSTTSKKKIKNKKDGKRIRKTSIEAEITKLMTY
jgi:hypothetical protein